MAKNKRFKKNLVIFFILIIIIGAGSFTYYKNVVNKPLKSKEDKIDIKVEDGEAFYSLLDRLSQENILRSKLVVKINLKLTGKNVNIVPGEYEVSKDITLDELIEELETEDKSKNQVKVTIPEGYNIEKMAETFSEEGLFTKDEFISAVKNYKTPSYVKNNNDKKYNLEGYLYPDTYFFDKECTPDLVIETMLKKFESVIDSLEKDNSITIEDKDLEDIIIKASLIEKEARLDSERPLVASVIENRLKKNMKLEFCSTINYIIGYEKTELTYSDLKVESKYNTYKYAGLPIGPVASPGIESIKAALKPENTNYLYFVLTSDDKSHHFSETLEEHEKAKVQAEEERKNRSNN